MFARGSVVVTALLAVSGWVLVFAPSHAVGTDVQGGVIWEKTTWTLVRSPYRVFGDVIVAANAALEIEPGVTVLFEGNWTLQGNIYANGTSAAPITFTSASPPSAPYQWGPLALRSGREFRVYASSGVQVRGGPIRACEVALAEYGLWIGPYTRGRVEDCTVRDVLTDAVILEGTREFVFANLTIQRAGVGLAILHFGPGGSGQDAVRNLFTHLSLTDAMEGVRRTDGDSGSEGGNLLVHSRFEDVKTVFADPFPGVAHHNAFFRSVVSFRGSGHSIGSYDDDKEGNYWDAYGGSDGDGDGVGETPYAWDRHPLVVPPTGAGTYAGPPPPPVVESTEPPSGAAEIPSGITVEIRFSERMATVFLPGEVLTATHSLHGLPVWFEGRMLLVRPSDEGSRLLRNTTYELAVGGWLPSLHGVPLGADGILRFSTRPPPIVVSSSPLAGAESVSLNVPIILRFNVPMNRTSVEDALAVGDGIPYDVSWSEDSREVRILPHRPLPSGQLQSITIETTARDEDGMHLPRFQLFFRTIARVQPWAPGGAGFYGAVAIVAVMFAFLVWIRLRPHRRAGP